MEDFGMVQGITSIFGFLAVCVVMMWKIVSDKKDNDKSKENAEKIAKILEYVTTEREESSADRTRCNAKFKTTPAQSKKLPKFLMAYPKKCLNLHRKQKVITIIKQRKMNKTTIKIIVCAVICAVFVVLLSVSGCQTQKLKKANQEYKEQNEQFKASNEQLRAQIDSLNTIAEQIRTENLVFKESNEILSQNLKDLKVENANFIVENERLKAHIASLDDLTKRFDELLQRLDTEVSRIERIK